MVFLGIVAMMATTINGFVIFGERLRKTNTCLNCTDTINQEEDNEEIKEIINDILEPVEGYVEHIHF